jgi:asparagine synthase (glutamine-hydrolysing)
MDFKNYLSDDILAKVDRASMSVALESREPFLDHKIIEYAATLPLSYKYRKGKRKYILRKILSKYLPEALFDRPKQGFALPVEEWLGNDLKPLFTDYLSEQRINKGGIFNPEIITRMLDDYLKGRGGNAHKLWFLLMFEMWREKWC